MQLNKFCGNNYIIPNKKSSQINDFTHSQNSKQKKNILHP